MKNNFKENDELDIIILANKLKQLFQSISLQIFRSIKTFLTKWKLIGAIVLVGLILGYLQTDTDSPKSKEATILVKINFDAGNYIYSEIEQINRKILDEDQDFFTQEMKLNNDETIDEISIFQVIDIKDIVAKDIQANEIRALFERFASASVGYAVLQFV